MSWIIYFVLFIVLVVVGVYLALKLHTCNDPDAIHRNVARRLIEKNAFNMIIDVRTYNEWRGGHHPLGVHIPLMPLNGFREKIKRLDREGYYLIYCRTGNRAKQAWKEMKKLGFKNVFFFIGGVNDLI